MNCDVNLAGYEWEWENSFRPDIDSSLIGQFGGKDWAKNELGFVTWPTFLSDTLYFSPDVEIMSFNDTLFSSWQHKLLFVARTCKKLLIPCKINHQFQK